MILERIDRDKCACVKRFGFNNFSLFRLVNNIINSYLGNLILRRFVTAGILNDHYLSDHRFISFCLDGVLPAKKTF